MISLLEIELRKLLTSETQLLSQYTEALSRLGLNSTKFREDGEMELADSMDSAVDILQDIMIVTKNHIGQLNELLNKILRDESQYEIGKKIIDECFDDKGFI